MIDLRSDTVTYPTEEMYEAMRSAPLGDDVLGDDPTVNEFEQMAAERTGKEAALLVPSGTMANLISILGHCGRGEEVILGDKAHTFCYEAGGISAYGSVHPHTVANEADGTIKLGAIEAAIRTDNVHFPRTKLICLENTHNKCGGVILSPDYTDTVGKLAKKSGLKLHIDGARIFNAAVSLGMDVKELTRSCDSLSFCLSKGLCCPVGSVVCGPTAFIHEGRRTRKGLGGGMRQAGIIAAAGIVALNTMVDRLAHDHANAKALAKGFSGIDGIDVNIDSVQTNMVYFTLTAAAVSDEALLSQTAKKGLQFLAVGPRTFRMVTHHGIECDDVDATLGIMREILT
ncbi:MAG: low-specificity L-threonine aldolase [Anaerohalosphaeraceae bacterium]